MTRTNAFCRATFPTLVLACISACGGGSTAPAVAVATVTVSPLTANIEPGGTTTLSATTKDASGATLTGRTITWSSTAPSVATVVNGTVTAIASGSATIHATSEGKTGDAVITVAFAVAVASMTLSPDSSDLAWFATRQLSAATLDAGGAPLSGRVISYQTSSATIASVSSAGVVTANSPGTVTITA